MNMDNQILAFKDLMVIPTFKALHLHANKDVIGLPIIQVFEVSGSKKKKKKKEKPGTKPILGYGKVQIWIHIHAIMHIEFDNFHIQILVNATKDLDSKLTIAKFALHFKDTFGNS